MLMIRYIAVGITIVSPITNDTVSGAETVDSASRAGSMISNEGMGRRVSSRG